MKSNEIRLVGKGQSDLEETTYRQVAGDMCEVCDYIGFPDGRQGRVVRVKSNEVTIVPRYRDNFPSLSGTESVFIFERPFKEIGGNSLELGLDVRCVLDRIILKQDEGKSEVHGFAIPDSEKQKPLIGIVMAHGPGWTAPETGKFTPITVKVGDKVHYMEHSGVQVEIKGDKYILIKERDLILIE